MGVGGGVMVPLHPYRSPCVVDVAAARGGQPRPKCVGDGTREGQPRVQHIISQVPQTELGVLPHRAKSVRHGWGSAALRAVA